MTGGTGMYIHNYQIQNVLNAYRKQLSQSPDKAYAGRSTRSVSRNEATLSGKGQPPAIVNQISTEIIDRITRFESQSELDNAIANQITASPSDSGQQINEDFTYTLIDEQNRKTTQTLQTQSVDTLKYNNVRQNQALVNPAKDQESGKALLNNSPETPRVWKG